METRTYNVYKFKELSIASQRKALESLRDINVDYKGWADTTKDEWTSKLDALGYYGATILFSGFSSQGDGACFTALVAIRPWLKAHGKLRKFPNLAKHDDLVNMRITHADRYYHSKSTDVAYEIVTNEETNTGNLWDELDSEAEELQAQIKLDRALLGDMIYGELETSYSILTSDDAIIETIEANDYDFTDSGELD